jgi:hypothetical protein
MDKYQINDIRLINEFKGITFSNYKKSEVKKELLKSLNNSKIEDSCYWASEFICSGHFLDLWDIILLFISKNIHLGNPKLPIYLELRYNQFKDILQNGYVDNELNLRNNNNIRKLFAEIICIICQSKKKNSFDVPKITDKDYDLSHMHIKLEAENINYAKKFFLKEDPNELFIAINEFAWNINSKIKNSTKAFFWVEWILNFETIIKKNKTKKLICARRQYPVDNNFQKDFIWIVWDIISKESLKITKDLNKIIKALINLFCIRYKPSVKKKRKFLIYFGIFLITEYYDTSIPIVNNKNIINKVKSNINIIFKEIKKCEIHPKTDYLFNNSINKNLENTVTKLNKMNSLINIIPRQ